MDTLNQRIVDLMLAGKATELAALYAPDALADINVPLWRYQVLGQDVEPVLRKEFDVPDRVVTYHRISVLSDGIALEAEFRYTDNGETRLWRDINLFRTDGERIIEQTTYCTGQWDAGTIARQAIEAPMVRP